jgi:superfamily II DNA or RNA helicase
MRVEIAGYAWLDRSTLTDRQVSNIVTRLTIQPKQTSDIAQAETPAPIHLYRLDEARNMLGVPRGFYRHMGTGVHDEVLKVGWGAPMRKLETTARFEGPFAEQAEAIEALLAALYPPWSGPEAPPWGGALLQAQPAAGKTVMALEVARRLGRRTLILVHQEFFLDQWSKRIQQFLPEARIGIIQQDRCEYARTKTGESPDFVIGILQSLARDTGGRYPREMYEDSFGLVISDECFVESQLIQTRNGVVAISDIRAGDVVCNAMGHGVVRESGSRLVPLDRLVLVTLSTGSEHICTEDHPFLTKEGWVAAKDAEELDAVDYDGCIDIVHGHGTQTCRDMRDVREGEFCSDREEVLLSGLHGIDKTSDRTTSLVRVVQDESSESTPFDFLFAILSAEISCDSDVGSFGRDCRSGKGVACGKSACSGGGIGTDDSAKSDEGRCCTREADKYVASDGPSPSGTRREWEGHVGSTGATPGRPRRWLGCRTHSQDQLPAGERRPFTESLQDRPGVCGSDDCGRGGRKFTSVIGRPAERSEEGCFLGGIRVARVSRAKSSDLERHGIRCEGDHVRVYNLSVNGHPSYVLDSGVVVHNCHRIGAASWGDIIPRFNAAYRLGLTATPRRKDGAEDVFFHHIAPVTYRATTESVKPKLRKIVTTTELRAISRGEYRVPVDQLNSAQIINQVCLDTFRTQAIVDDLVQAVQIGRKIMVVSARLDHLRDMADRTGQALFNLDLPFVPIQDFYTGQWFSHDVWDTTTKAHRKGDPKMVPREQADLDRAERANVIFATQQMVLEGLDIPALDVLLLATPISDVEQAAGRVRRWCLPEPNKCEHYCPWRAGKCKGKPTPIIVDVMDLRIPRLKGMAARREKFYKTCCTM